MTAREEGMQHFRLLARAVLGVAAAIAMSGSTVAQTWPARPIEVVVPFGSGGGSDSIVRIIQRTVAERGWLKQPIVVQNVGGAGGRTGSRQAMKASPDGYTFLTSHLTLMTGQGKRRRSSGL